MTSSSDSHPPSNRRVPELAVLVSSAVLVSGVAVVEGMPGAGKTTALTALADRGWVVLGEYTDDHAQARHLARTDGVIADRNWLTALGWAASVNGLTDRAAWAHMHLTTGDLTLPEQWIVLDCGVETSLARRRDQLDATHPWANPDVLHRLRAFYADPAGTIAPELPDLADLISSVPVVRVDAEASRDAVVRAVAEAMS